MTPVPRIPARRCSRQNQERASQGMAGNQQTKEKSSRARQRNMSRRTRPIRREAVSKPSRPAQRHPAKVPPIAHRRQRPGGTGKRCNGRLAGCTGECKQLYRDTVSPACGHAAIPVARSRYAMNRGFGKNAGLAIRLRYHETRSEPRSRYSRWPHHYRMPAPTLPASVP